MLIQLRTGHIQLYYHLHRTQQTDSPTCPCCNQHQETVVHFLLLCPAHKHARSRLKRAIGSRDLTLRILLSERTNLKHLFSYLNDTKRFAHVYGVFPPIPDKSDDND
ncbi:hypothetical protein K435DRAFT_684596 [Dendrothele bispora CBS 962.96]|uniref:Reverse transcriptase zinc-binding domain-containing protein n=1 Tax=Dendrothele bispora (strain CBS 962.96) TaxID=1314807 RepID=A0A4S8LBF1_DENBC|nr:hypothetical protein K435DRAFT_684596 [Dendrothele bispora CBS 962.96]